MHRAVVGFPLEHRGVGVVGQHLILQRLRGAEVDRRLPEQPRDQITEQRLAAAGRRVHEHKAGAVLDRLDHFQRGSPLMLADLSDPLGQRRPSRRGETLIARIPRGDVGLALIEGVGGGRSRGSRTLLGTRFGRALHRGIPRRRTWVLTAVQDHREHVAAHPARSSFPVRRGVARAVVLLAVEHHLVVVMHVAQLRVARHAPHVREPRVLEHLALLGSSHQRRAHSFHVLDRVLRLATLTRWPAGARPRIPFGDGHELMIPLGYDD